MSKDVDAPCEACGGLLPLKAIRTTRTRGRHPQRHRHSYWVHPKEKKPDAHLERRIPEEKPSPRHGQRSGEGSTSQDTRKSRRSRRLSNEDQAEVSNRLSYGQFSKPEQFQAHQKAEKDVRCGIHGELNIPFQQAQSQPAFNDLCPSKKTLNLGDLDLSCHLHRQDMVRDVATQMSCKRLLAVSQSVAPEHHHYEECASLPESYPGVYEACHLHRHESTSTRFVGHLPPKDILRDVATQMSCKRLLASVSRQTRRDEESTSQSVAPEHHHYEECASLPEPYPGVFEECHLHHHESTCTRVVGHLPQEDASHFSSNPSVSTSHMVRHVATQMSCKRLLAVSRQTRRDEEATSQPEHDNYEECASPGVYEECHFHHIEEHVIASPRGSSRDSRRCGLHLDQEESLFACHQSVVHLQSPKSRDSTNVCERCGLPEPAQNGFSSPGTNDSRLKLCAQMSTRSELHSPCNLHGDCASGVSSHPPAPKQRKRPKKGKFHGCHLHRDLPASEESRMPRIRWLDRLLATQHIPPQIIREFLQGIRGWPPDAMKQKCPGCIKKQTDEDDEDNRAPSPNIASWNPGSAVAKSEVKQHPSVQDEKLARLLLARSLLIKPVVKLSTSKSAWRSRKELQYCSECWNPTKFGRWRPILKEMANDTSNTADMSNCDRKFSSCTAHGNPPNPIPEPNLRCPQLFSALNKRSQAQELQNATFDRVAALKVARMKCIELDEEVLVHVHEKRSPPRSKPASPSMLRSQNALAHRRQELYVGLSKIALPPTRIRQTDNKRSAFSTR